MELAEFWKLFLKTTQYSGAIASLILNSILITLIILRSPKSLGIYKYLMIYIALFEAAYSILDVITEPSIFSYQAAFIVFRDFKHSIFGKEASFLLVCIYGGCFGFSLAIFAVHFIYRYSAIDLKFRKLFLSGRKVYVLFLIPIIYGAGWTIIGAIFFRATETTNSYVRNALLNSYDLRVEDISYGIVLFYLPNDYGGVDPDFRIFWAIGGLWFMIISSFISVMVFGLKCYNKLTRALETTQMASSFTKSLQQQLFQALVCQTLIPVFLMYIPIAVLFTCPMFNMDVGFASSFVAATIAIYPATDPLPTMLIIKNYRRTLFCRGCGKK